MQRNQTRSRLTLKVRHVRWISDAVLMFATSATTLNEIKLKLAKEDAAEASRGRASEHEVSPSTFVEIGLDLEDQQ